MIKIIKKDITTVEGQCAIAHGVNCQGVMESGVAKAISEKWPFVKESYLKLGKKNMHLRKIQPVIVNKDLIVFNIFSQINYGYDNNLYACKYSIDWGLRACLDLCELMNFKKLYVSKIGCGLGGLDWEKDVHPIFKYNSEYYDMDLIVCEI